MAVSALKPHGRSGGHPGQFVAVELDSQRRCVAFDEISGGVASQERLVAQGGHQKVPVGCHPAQMEALQGPGQAGRRLDPGRCVGDHLGQHGVEVDADGGAGLHPGVEADGRFAGRGEGSQGASGRQEPRRGVLGVEAGLDGVAGGHHVVLVVAERFPGGDPDLFPDQVDAGGLFGDRVFDLESSVDLKEEELPGGVVEEELHGAR